MANWDWVIYQFRLALAKRVSQQGHEVICVCPPGTYIDSIENQDLRWVRWDLDRRSINPFKEAHAIAGLGRIYERESPDLIHHDTIKPNVYGPLAESLFAGSGGGDSAPTMVNSFMGTGYLFSDHMLARVLRAGMVPLMRRGLSRSNLHVTFSNRSDYRSFVRMGLVDPDRATVLTSEYVDTATFVPNSEGRSEIRGGTVRVLLAARLLWDKGIGTFVRAARSLNGTETDVEFLLAGEPDEGARGAVPRYRLKEWDDSGVINWLGYQDDMPSLLQAVDIAVLPTQYNEGLPRFLVEAASAGLPLVASDLSGCRRVVSEGVNGRLIPTKSPTALASAVRSLSRRPEERRRMGENSRMIAVERFDKDRLIDRWVRLYEDLTGGQRTG